MKSSVQPLRGMEDIWGDQARLFRIIEAKVWQLAQRYHYQEIRTPLLEHTEVFHRTLGESSDAVQKETYTFIDRSGDSVTLRPEGTASVVRAVLSQQLVQELPLKLYYCGPMFRHERPQKGRLRQFHQIGVEALGYRDPWSDVESILLGYQVLTTLGLHDRCQLELNSLGDRESRLKHRQAFVAYLEPFKNELSPESQVRLQKNPLRIFDSKNQIDQEIVKKAPLLEEFLSESSRAFFEHVQAGLRALNVPFTINSRLVRGFDYYTHTVFEFTTQELGSQSAVLSGGRYDHLVAEMGGPDVPAVGWALGLERISMMLDQSQILPKKVSIALLPLEPVTAMDSLFVMHLLRQAGWECELFAEGKLAKRIQKAEKKGFTHVAFYGPDERANQQLAVKELKSGNQTHWDLKQPPLVETP